MNGRTVITSKENLKIPASIKTVKVFVHQTKLEWKFKSRLEAIEASKAFAEAGFTYVYRP